MITNTEIVGPGSRRIGSRYQRMFQGAFAAAMLSFACAAVAAPGALDPSFGNGGAAVFGFGDGNDVGVAMAIQANQQILVLGSSSQNGVSKTNAVVRRNTDGSPDLSFNTTGKVFVPVGAYGDNPAAIKLDASGRILVGGTALAGPSGTSAENFSVARLNTDGSLDTTFGNGGKVVVPAIIAGWENNTLTAMTLLPNGQILLTGNIRQIGVAGQALAITRLNADGGIDTSFGSGGNVIVYTLDGTYGFYPATILTDASGRIVIPGTYGDPNGPVTTYCVKRFNADGSPDTTFAGTGSQLYQVEQGISAASDARIDAQGRIVVVGETLAGAAVGASFSAIRLNGDGSPDSSFGSGGAALVMIGTANDDDDAEAAAMGIDASGNIVIVGTSTPYLGVGTAQNPGGIALARLTADGAPDTSFGTGGQLQLGGGSPSDMAIDGSGRILVAGVGSLALRDVSYLIVRFLQNGSRDDSFGNSAEVNVEVGISNNQANAIAQQGDGKLVVASQCDCNAQPIPGVARLNTNGSLDSSFGNSGTVTLTESGANAYPATGVALDAQGRIIVAGSFTDSSDSGFLSYAVVRLNPDGSVDSTFASGGQALIAATSDDNKAYAVAVDAAGGILVAGSSTFPENVQFTYQPSVIRLNADGSLDPTFGTAGKVFVSNVRGGAYAMLLDASGRIVLDESNSAALVVTRLLANGSLDTTFGSGGTAASGILDANAAMGIDAGGRILVAGFNTTNPTSTIAVSALNQDGTPDTSFGTGGIALITAPVYVIFSVTSLAIDRYGKIVVAGQGANQGTSAAPSVPLAVLFRLNPDGSPDSTFGNSGVSIVQPPSGSFYGNAMVLDSSGNIVFAGAATGDTMRTAGETTGTTEVLRLDGSSPPPATGVHTDISTYLPLATLGGGYESFIRVINTGAAATPVTVARIDPTTGVAGAAGLLSASLEPGAASIFSSQQVEVALGTALAASDRPRILVGANSAIETQSYLLQPGGVFNEVSPAFTGASIVVPTYVPAAAAPTGYESVLRIINSGSLATPVTVARIDPASGQIGTPMPLTASLPAGAAMTFVAGDIEAALGFAISASERPSLAINAANSVLQVQAFLTQPGGAYTNISTSQSGSPVDVRSYLPAAAAGYTSVLRIVNSAASPASITATVLDGATGAAGASGTVATALPSGAAILLMSAQIESALGVSLPSASRPRIRVNSSAGNVTVQSFLLQPGGAFNEISGALTAPPLAVPLYVPAADAATGYASYIRVINTGTASTAVSVALIDGVTGLTGAPGVLTAALAAGAAQTFGAGQIEAALGSPVAAGTRPRLLFSSQGGTLEVQSFLLQPGGAYTEISSWHQD